MKYVFLAASAISWIVFFYLLLIVRDASYSAERTNFGQWGCIMYLMFKVSDLEENRVQR